MTLEVDPSNPSHPLTLNTKMEEANHGTTEAEKGNDTTTKPGNTRDTRSWKSRESILPRHSGKGMILQAP